MKKLKIVVYTISKNEEKFVSRWVKSMSEADEICVLDTGSTDKTVELLKNAGVKTKVKEIVPWRFDDARNESLKLVPEDADICVCTDLDEVFKPGWRKELEKAWKEDTTRIRYNYNWSLDENDKPIVNFYADKIHKRHGYRWVNAVHEILATDEQEKFELAPNIILNHYPDSTKSRASYLPLLELSVKDNPNNDRNMHYLGREYMYYGRWNDAIDTLIKHLKMPSATWKDERCASMRFIGRCYANMERFDEAKMWFDKAMAEAPYLRDAFVERALLAYRLNEWDDVQKYCLKALEITSNVKSYINETFSWDNTVYDLLSISSFYKNDFKSAIKWVDLALEYDKDDERLLKNKELFLKYEQDNN